MPLHRALPSFAHRLPLAVRGPSRRRAVLRPWILAAAWAASAAVVLPARAADADLGNVVSFQASASTEVPKDTLTIVLQVVRDGADAASVQTGLEQVISTALTQAKRQAEAEVMEVRTGGFHVGPRYGRDGRITGWQGTAELVLEGRDLARVATTAGRLNGLQVTSTSFSVSRGLRDRVESELSAQAVRKFRQRADELARQFGFPGYRLREVQVQGIDAELQRPVVALRSMARDMAVAADAPVPVEPGRSVLTATVQGSIVLTNSP